MQSSASAAVRVTGYVYEPALCDARSMTDKAPLPATRKGPGSLASSVVGGGRRYSRRRIWPHPFAYWQAPLGNTVLMPVRHDKRPHQLHRDPPESKHL